MSETIHTLIKKNTLLLKKEILAMIWAFSEL